MRERPILFSAPMVRAILEDRKTQTRRVVRDFHSVNLGIEQDIRTGEWVALWDSPTNYDGEVQMNSGSKVIHCPYGQPGDRLRVKEAAWMWCERRPNGKTKTGRDKWLYVPMREAPIHYAADHPTRPSINVVSPHTGNVWGWRLKIGRFLPAWASRITLEVTGVRVERLQEISEADAIAEGCDCARKHPLSIGFRQSFQSLWESIHGAGSWDSNPWLWVVEFKRITP